MITDAVESEQLPIINDDLFKLNFNYLTKYFNTKKLKEIVKSLGKSIYINNTRKDKSQLIHDILKNSEYLKPKKQLDLEIKKIEYEKKVIFYKDLPNKLYSKTTDIKNKNYSLFIENNIMIQELFI